LKSSVDAITTKAIMQEVTAIHSSVWYGKDIGYPSHAQTNNIGPSKGITYMHKLPKNNHIPLVVTYITKCLKIVLEIRKGTGSGRGRCRKEFGYEGKKDI